MEKYCSFIIINCFVYACIGKTKQKEKLEMWEYPKNHYEKKQT